MQLRALTFDIIGTVVDAYDGPAHGVAPLNAKYDVSVNGAAFASGSLTGYSQGVAQVRSSGSWVSPDTILQNATSANLPIAQLGVEANTAINDFFNLRYTLPRWPDALSGMAALHQHYTLAILSNMSLATRATLRAHAHLLIDTLLSAETARHYKPEPAVYDMAISSIGVSSSEILMVAAHNYDLNAARQQGLRTTFVVRPAELGPAGSPVNGLDPSFDFNATSLIDLAEQLGAFLVSTPNDCLPLDPRTLQVQLIGEQWTIVDRNQWVLVFGALKSGRKARKVDHCALRFRSHLLRRSARPADDLFHVRQRCPIGRDARRGCCGLQFGGRGGAASGRELDRHRWRVVPARLWHQQGERRICGDQHQAILLHTPVFCRTSGRTHDVFAKLNGQTLPLESNDVYLA